MSTPSSANVPTAPPGWADLGWRARSWRMLHVGWSVVQLTSLAVVWSRVVTGRRDRALTASVALLTAEGGALVIGRGNCPVGPLQASWGDPVPLFELVLPPRAARAAVPVLAVVSLAGIGGLAVPPTARRWRERMGVEPTARRRAPRHRF